MRLSHGQQVRIAGSAARIYVGSIEGSCRTSGADLAQATDRHLTRGWPLAWTTRAPYVLEDDHPGKAESLRMEQEQTAAAVVLEHGQQVSIEGRLYRVRLIGGNFSDPIHFDIP
jgi:hypothetical protein